MCSASLTALLDYPAQAAVTRSVTTSSQKILDKLERKDKRRAGARGTDADLDWLATRGFDELVEAEVMRDSKCATNELPASTVSLTSHVSHLP